MHRQAARYVWALLLARIYEALPLTCPQCGGAMRIIAFITETAVIREILGHLREPKSPPRLMPAREPPLWEISRVKRAKSACSRLLPLKQFCAKRCGNAASTGCSQRWTLPHKPTLRP